ncbi:MAG TPA: SMC-Scp complex subunit ScpB [Chitinophagaceae bacterium]
MELSNLIPHIEALIFASDKPLTAAEITDLINSAFGFMEDKLEQEQIDAALEGIVEKYNSEFYPFEVRQSGGGWQFLTKKDFHKTVAQLNGEKFLKRLSAAALETLAIIAYKQPITKGEIEAIRGVSSDYSVQKLLEKELIIISGRNEKLPGHPLVYNTSKSFMDYFGINSPEDLPKIKEVLADQIIEPTVVHHTDFEQPSALVVTDQGELVEDAATSNPGDAGTTPAAAGYVNEPSPGERRTEEGDPEIAELADEEYIMDQSFQVENDPEAAGQTLDNGEEPGGEGEEPASDEAGPPADEETQDDNDSLADDDSVSNPDEQDKP